MSRVNLTAHRAAISGKTLLAAACAGLLATGVNADTLAQPQDNALEREAANYIRFREDVTHIEAQAFTNANVTREAHRMLGSHDPKAISDGWVAYAALVAASQPEFSKAMQKELKKSKQRGMSNKQAFLSKLSQNPRLPRSLDGGKEAVDAILAMAVRDGARITALGESFKSQAYAMQKTAWGKKRISSGGERVSDAESFSRSRPSPVTPVMSVADNDGVASPRLSGVSESWDANWGQAAGQGYATEHNADVIIDRALNLAARYSVGAMNSKLVDVYAKNDKSERCLSMAKLTLNQCIAATRSPYEEAFCLGEHALNDIATCTGWVAGS